MDATRWKIGGNVIDLTNRALIMPLRCLQSERPVRTLTGDRRHDADFHPHLSKCRDDDFDFAHHWRSVAAD